MNKTRIPGIDKLEFRQKSDNQEAFMSSPEPRIIKGSDIIFECPSCSKSMAIDFAGAGLLINCPECGIPIQVPGDVPQSAPASTNADDIESEVTISQEKVQLLVESFDEINSRREKTGTHADRYLLPARADSRTIVDYPVGGRPNHPHYPGIRRQKALIGLRIKPVEDGQDARPTIFC
ncbi:MAG: hypothetical protein AAF492_14975 [Verrucomicrobiota bacterium]